MSSYTQAHRAFRQMPKAVKSRLWAAGITLAFGGLSTACAPDATAPRGGAEASAANTAGDAARVASIRAATKDLALLKAMASDPVQREHWSVGTSWKADGNIDDLIAQLQADIAGHEHAVASTTRGSARPDVVPAPSESRALAALDGTPDYRVHGSVMMTNTANQAPSTRLVTFNGYTSCDASLGSDTMASGYANAVGKDQFNRVQLSVTYSISPSGNFYGSGSTNTYASGDPLYATSNGQHYCDTGLYGKLSATSQKYGYV